MSIEELKEMQRDAGVNMLAKELEHNLAKERYYVISNAIMELESREVKREIGEGR